MKTKTRKLLPKTTAEITNGGLYIQRVRCGKQNCKCARGEMHPAYYFFTRRNGKLLKIYVRKAEINAFALITKQAAFERRRQRQAVKSSLDLLRTFRADLSKYNGLLKTLKDR
jgi:hypothetical protein